MIKMDSAIGVKLDKPFEELHLEQKKMLACFIPCKYS